MLSATLLAGIGLFCAPAEITGKGQAVVRDLLRPGQVTVFVAREWTRDRYEAIRNRFLSRNEEPNTSAAVAVNDQQLQVLRAENAWLREQLTAAKSATQSAHSTDPLVVPEIVEARVLGQETLQRAHKSYRSLLGVGEQQGVDTSSLVLAGGGPQIDLGQEAGLAADHLILAGRAVVGKVAQVGRFTSTLLPITDKQYRGLARLARPAGSGLEFGAEGILEGDGGEACRLNFIQSTEPVSVGDSIYTVSADGSFNVPLLYGTVVEADLPAGAPHWTIRVKPAADFSKLRKVEIVRTAVNPLRLNAH